MTVPAPATIVLADDHPVVRRGIRLVLDAEPDLHVVGEAGDGADAIELVLREHADLVVLDVSMPRMTGLQAAAELRRRAPEARTLMLSMHESEQFLFEALRAGASGYVLKSGADSDLVDACRMALRGSLFLYPSAISALVRTHLSQGAANERTQILTPREIEILKLIAEAHSAKEIADMLVLSVKTVDRHRANILDKLGLHDRVELTRYAIRSGLVEP